MRPICHALSLLVWLPACSLLQPHPDWVQKPPTEAVQHVLSGEALLGRPVRRSELPSADLFELSPTMKVAAEAIGELHSSMYDRAEALHHKLLSSPLRGGFGVQYTAESTLTAAEAFEQREVNCLSYTLMFVAMARHMGLKVYVNSVELPPSWDLRADNSLMLLHHVNAKVTMNNGDELVVDLEMDRYSTVYEQNRVADRSAAALFHNNRGMEFLGARQFERGFRSLRKAIELDNTRSYMWNNLGNLYYRRDLLAEAETAYLHGLGMAPRDLTIMSNLTTLYETLGQQEKADYFARRVREHRNQNPYYIYTQAREALRAGFAQRAERLILKAIDKQKNEPRFYNLAADIYQFAGEPNKAESMRRRAEELKQDLFL